MENLAGKAWGRFQIMEERGRGGMAVVYKAYDEVLQRTVALKVLLAHLAADKQFTERFRREAITAANLRHPNIVVIYDVGSHENFQYIVMEYVEGPTLQQEIHTKGMLPLPRVMSISGQLAAALDYAHQQRLVHRDIKPANILIGAEDHVTLTDFGLVKAAGSKTITGEGAAVGTLKYMSPEQATGTDLDSRSDVYSFGIVVYEMLAGETPFAGTTPYQTLYSVMYKPPPPLSRRYPHITPKMEAVVFKALSKEPDQRYLSAGQFARALAALTGLGAALDSMDRTTSRAQRAVLVLVTSDGREFPVFQGQVTIGRDTGNNIVIPDRQVSRYHARIRCSRRGCSVEDLGSTNGTFVNGASLASRAPRSLRPGDLLGVGPVVLTATHPFSSENPDAQRTDRDIGAG